MRPPVGKTQRVSQPRKSERRAYVRHRPARRMTCLLGADGPGLSAVVQNLSARGLALLAAKWIEVGEVVAVRLFNEEMTVCLVVNLRVTRRGTLPNGECFIAGELDRVLEPAELLPFMA